MRGRDRRPGEFRTSPNWIGGATLDTAVFVRVVLDDPIGRPASVVQALDRRDRYTGAGEHLGRTETSAASLDLAGLPARRTVAGRGFADLVFRFGAADVPGTFDPHLAPAAVLLADPHRSELGGFMADLHRTVHNHILGRPFAALFCQQ